MMVDPNSVGRSMIHSAVAPETVSSVPPTFGADAITG